MSAVQLRPLRIGEVLDAAIKIYLRNAGQLFRSVLAVVVPVQILTALVQSSAISGGTVVNGRLTGVQQGGYLAAQLVIGVLTGLTALLASGACFKAVSDAYMGEAPNWRDSLRFAFGKLGSLLWLTVIVVVILILAFIALVLPGIYLGVAFAVALPVLLVEDIRGFKALSRSFQLTKGRWWPTFGTLLVALVLLYVVGIVIGLIFAALASAIISGSSSNLVLFVVISAVLGIISRTLTTPFFAACATVIYYDLRVRKEGYDLELLARDIGRSGPGGLERPDGPPSPQAQRTGGSIPPPEAGSPTFAPD